ncbi:MAG: hypothetical protein U0V87_01165 [Acidobacteriota bacterium]
MNFSGGSIAPEYEVMPERRQRRSRAADVTTTTELFDWKPKVALDDGLQRTIDRYLQRWSSQTQHTKGNDGD